MQVFVFPFASVTVSVTVFGPKFAQVNESGVAESVVVVQLSLDPLLICAAVTEPVPAPLSCTVLFWQIAVGRVVSDTVTVDVQVAVFPLASVTVSVTVFGPTFAHVKLSGVAEIVKVQLSVEALLICAAVTVSGLLAYHHSRSSGHQRINCESNLKQIGLAFRSGRNDLAQSQWQLGLTGSVVAPKILT